MTTDDWTALLDNPKAILGPYGGKAPSLDTFAPYAWHARFDHVSIAGHFLCLPETVPASWGPPHAALVDAVIEFSEARLLRVDGFLKQGPEADTLHGDPRGSTGQCSLIAMSDPFISGPDGSVLLHWKRFSFSQEGCSLLVEAGNVRITYGRRAAGQAV